MRDDLLEERVSRHAEGGGGLNVAQEAGRLGHLRRQARGQAERVGERVPKQGLMSAAPAASRLALARAILATLTTASPRSTGFPLSTHPPNVP